MDHPPQDTAELAIPVTQEQLEVDRRVVETGGAVRVRKQVEQVPAQVREALATERVDVQRVPVGRVVSQAPAVRQEGDVTVVPVVQERLVTRKELCWWRKSA